MRPKLGSPAHKSHKLARVNSRRGGDAPAIHELDRAAVGYMVGPRKAGADRRFPSSQSKNMGREMIREFKYRGETFRVNAHGVAGHEEVFIIHLVDGEEMAEISIDRMTEENDTSAPIEAICVMLCDKLIAEENIECAGSSGGFTWVEGARARDVLPSNSGALAH